MRAVAYVRVSSEAQVDNWSIPAQAREFDQYCRAKGWVPAGVYAEEGVSAPSDSIERRPVLRRRLHDSAAGLFDAVVVHSLDRWSRNLRVTLETFKYRAEHRIAFVSITENLDYSSPEGRLFIAMIGAFAQYFSDSLAKHTRKGLRERAARGLHNGDVPFGYERCACCPARLHPHPTEAEAIRQLFQMSAGGGWSLSQLAGGLNEQGFRTRNKHRIETLRLEKDWREAVLGRITALGGAIGAPRSGNASRNVCAG